MLIEYLYQNGGKLTATDSQGRGCLHLAAQNTDPNIVVMLLKKGAIPGLKDMDGKDPISYAMEKPDGDIITV